MSDHIEAKRKGRTAELYRDILERLVKPAVGTTKADTIGGKSHADLHQVTLRPCALPIVRWWIDRDGCPASLD